jgi:NAD(P)-dependent dehydrogenase (short-subunit alcohol dehydrogenase family)
MKRILITGCSRGIGRALVEEFLANGWQVCATARQLDKLTGLRGASALALDVCDDDSVAAAREALGWDSLDALINNAAVFPGEGNETFEATDLEWFREAFDSNVVGPARVTRAFLPLLRNTPGARVINISSGAGSISEKEDSLYYPYSVSKAALNMLTRALAAEFRDLIVTALSPGWVQTEMGGTNAPLTPRDSARSLFRTITGLQTDQSGKFLGRDGEPYAW